MHTLPGNLARRPPNAFLETLRRLVFGWEDRLFERLNRLDLGGVIAPAALADSSDAALPHATSYQAVWCRNVRELLREAARTGFALRSFVDLGSGKGKACFYAARHGSFESVIGVEFSHPLVEVASSNRQRVREAARIRFERADASNWTLPDHNCLVFLFNPFDEVVLGRFLEHNHRHFLQHDTLLAYANDVHAAELAQRGFQLLFRNPLRRTSLHRWPRT